MLRRSASRALPIGQKPAPTCCTPRPRGSEDGRVHGQQRGPRREERLRDVEHVDRADPGDQRGERDLEQLGRIGANDRVPQPMEQPRRHGSAGETPQIWGPRSHRQARNQDTGVVVVTKSNLDDPKVRRFVSPVCRRSG
jgi:hypothetical protein